MPATLVPLSQPEDARHLAAILAGANPSLTVVTAADRPSRPPPFAFALYDGALDALRILPPDIGAQELERRIRALRSVGQEGSRPRIVLHGHRFVLED